ncbi:Hypothetical predicted protein [Cloeon dipterum]|uniref:PDZ domain-containing protein n=1 Tax=Cloeon dipterum TaxID=197152 RepID=A0A8S1CPF4_9INSE|nr:Hypothetical predicted protein [Cloeon dipterum]
MVSTPLSAGAAEHLEHTAMQILQFKILTLIDNKEEIDKFNNTIETYLKDGKIIPLVQGLKRVIKIPARLQLFDDVRRIVPLRQQMEYNLIVPYTSNRTRNVELKRRAPSYDFGFSIRGGREHGTGFFVSHVEPNSEAFFQGLKVGDQFVRINGFSVEFAIHREVLQLIKSSTHLYLRVRSVGMIPVKDGQHYHDMTEEELTLLLRYNRPERVSLPANIGSSRRSGIVTAREVPPNLGKAGRSVSLSSVIKKQDPLSWQVVEGLRSTSPTYPSGRVLTRAQSESNVLDRHLEETNDIKLYLDLSQHNSLGVSICRGNKNRTGIFIQSIREHSLAAEAGFLPGDQIIECNGTNFEFIDFNDAVKILKEGKNLDLVIRRGLGTEFFGESSGYNSSSSSVNGDHHADGGKRLSLITEDPEDGERSRSNSRRGPDETLAVVMEHPADTVDSKLQEKLVKVLVHQEEEEARMNPLAQSSSGSSLSSFSSAVSLEAKRRAERREDDDNISVASQDKRRQHEIAITALPAERRQKHAQLMQEFQQVHSKMFSSTVSSHKDFTSHKRASRQSFYSAGNTPVDGDMPQRHESAVAAGKPLVTVRAYEDRVASARKVSERNASIAALITRQEMHSDARKSSEVVEMPSLDTLTLSPNPNQIKPPAVYFGGKPGKSTPGVVTITEYPTDRRPNPNKFEFLGQTNGHNGIHHHDDQQSALSSELNSTLSRSNLRQLSEPMPTPPPPPLSPHLQDNHHEAPARAQSPESIRIDMNGDASSELRRARSKLSAINALARARSPPPVIARKPIAIPYSELVNQSNQVAFDLPIGTQTGHAFEQSPRFDRSPSPEAAKQPLVHKPPSPPAHKQPDQVTVNGGNRTAMIMDALSNRVTIKFPNGNNANSAGTRGLDSLLATEPPGHGILKNNDANTELQQKHKALIQQKSITFGEITTMMTWFISPNFKYSVTSWKKDRHD